MHILKKRIRNALYAPYSALKFQTFNNFKHPPKVIAHCCLARGMKEGNKERTKERLLRDALMAFALFRLKLLLLLIVLANHANVEYHAKRTKTSDEKEIGVASFFANIPKTEVLSDSISPVCPQKLPDISNEQEALERMPKGRLEYLKRLLPHLRNQSEDCLYLNIYAPAMGECLEDLLILSLKVILAEVTQKVGPLQVFMRVRVTLKTEQISCCNIRRALNPTLFQRIQGSTKCEGCVEGPMGCVSSRSHLDRTVRDKLNWRNERQGKSQRYIDTLSGACKGSSEGCCGRTNGKVLGMPRIVNTDSRKIQLNEWIAMRKFTSENAKMQVSENVDMSSKGEVEFQEKPQGDYIPPLCHSHSLVILMSQHFLARDSTTNNTVYTRQYANSLRDISTPTNIILQLKFVAQTKILTMICLLLEIPQHFYSILHIGPRFQPDEEAGNAFLSWRQLEDAVSKITHDIWWQSKNQRLKCLPHHPHKLLEQSVVLPLSLLFYNYNFVQVTSLKKPLKFITHNVLIL
ncbi:Neuroligin-1 [Melipona quadrifasciata]|uniref:Neuroligin-1 n=1 Tax=Melipona quadrifasciata TaxID=166423 RepID=A0A0N0U7E2_9HYME|nr:Neuroligin-1 [Melipona quadrifasciata]